LGVVKGIKKKVLVASPADPTIVVKRVVTRVFLLDVIKKRAMQGVYTH
jgi:hypothetical protein